MTRRVDGVGTAPSTGETQLYLVRHAIAEPRGPSWPDDGLRPLSAEGRRRFAAAAAGLARLEGIPGRILSSPLVRARQTAELLAAASGAHPVVEVCAALEPGRSPSSVLTRLRQLKASGRVALVGHEPDLGHLAAALLGTTHPVAFKKGAICRIDMTRRGTATGTLVWFLPPAALRRLGK